MKPYDYRQSVKEDVWQYIRDNECYLADFDDKERYADRLNDDLWCEDSVTGNGSGSYTFSRYKAEENLAHNLELVADVISEFGLPKKENGRLDYFKFCEAEFWDVSIRCYLLNPTIYEIIESDEFQELWNKYHK